MSSNGQTSYGYGQGYGQQQYRPKLTEKNVGACTYSTPINLSWKK